MNINVIITGADRIRNEWNLGAATLPSRERALVRTYGALYQTRVRGRASGRPGPRAVTGDYRRSISLEMRSLPDGRSAAIVGTNRPQGPRLEFGFTGTDSLGRSYAQPPYPHFGPPLQRTVDELSYALQLAALRALGIT